MASSFFRICREKLGGVTQAETQKRLEKGKISHHTEVEPTRNRQ